MPDIRINVAKNVHSLWKHHAALRGYTIAGFIREAVRHYLANTPMPNTPEAELAALIARDGEIG